VILIIGYGNPLRSDDAIGQRIAQMMERRLKGETIEVITAYQLTPELVEPIRDAQRVIFVDARVGEKPGTVMQESVIPETGAGAFTHNVSPGTLLGAAGELYGMTPAGILISIVGVCFDYGSDLSPELNRVLPDIADRVEAMIKTNEEPIQEENHRA
jgi:hydrogenase maturation protease